MQITWLFGNGLDLSFGYKTSYMEFYYYLLNNKDKLNLENNVIFKKLENDYNKNEIQDWVDYELKLGKITNEISGITVDNYKKSKLQMDDLLKQYLEQISNSDIALSTEKITEIFETSVLNISNLYREVDNDKVKGVMADNYSQTYYLNAISFNYTKTVSVLWGKVEEQIGIQFFNSYPYSGYQVVRVSPFYVHGTLENDEMIIGVHNETQIDNKEFSENQIIHECLIKNKMLENAGQRNFHKFKSVVDNTSIFCLYGLSIGKTDKDYWMLIKNRLLVSRSLMIIYVFKGEKDIPQGIVRKNDVIKEIKKTFYLSSDATEEEIAILDDKIIVEINAKIFGNLVEKVQIIDHE